MKQNIYMETLSEKTTKLIYEIFCRHRPTYTYFVGTNLPLHILCAQTYMRHQTPMNFAL